MTLVTFIILLVLLGVIFYLVNRFVPMSPVFKTTLNIISVIIVIFLILALFNIFEFPFKIK